MTLDINDYLWIYDLSTHVEKNGGHLFFYVSPHVKAVSFTFYKNGWWDSESGSYSFTMYYGTSPLKNTVEEIIKIFNDYAAKVNFPLYL